MNCEKSAAIHFRPHSKTQTTHSFTCGNNDINVLNSYKYLGLVLTDSLNCELTVKSVAQSANRALGLLICKVKTNGGVPYECFVKLFDSLVWPIISYGAPIWGLEVFQLSRLCSIEHVSPIWALVNKLLQWLFVEIWVWYLL